MNSTKRFFYVKAMLMAIDKSRGKNPYPYTKSMSKSCGLRHIRHFEKVNKIKFNPYDKRHVLHVSNGARFGEIIRKLKIVHKSVENASN